MSLTKTNSKNNITSNLNSSIALDLSNHNLNNSSSKQKYSFPKSSRFDQSKSLCDSYYEMPSTKNVRTTSFGYGDKDMGIRTNRYAPQPTSYNIQSQFTIDSKKKRGTSFGPGREEMRMGGPLGDSITRKFIPGPGNYTYKQSTLENNSITLRSRLPDHTLDNLRKNPGPGTYKFDQLGSSAYYATSKHPNRTNLAKIPSSGHKDLNLYKTLDVSPGQYKQDQSAMKPDGKYFISQVKNSQARVFSRSPRESIVYKHLLQTPGPTHYKIFNEFGPA